VNQTPPNSSAGDRDETVCVHLAPNSKLGDDVVRRADSQFLYQESRRRAMPKRKSLADEIASFMDTRPSDGLDEDFNEDEQRDDLLAPDDVAAMGQRRMRAQGIDLSGTGSKYAGRVTSRAVLESRKRLRAPGAAAAAAAAEDGEAEEDNDNVDEEEEEEDEASDQHDDGSEEDDEDDEDTGRIDDKDDKGDGAGEGNALYSEWKDMQAQESELLSQLKESQADEMERARQVGRQHTACLQLLQVRIKLQPALTAAARWPVALAPPLKGLWGATVPLTRAAKASTVASAALLKDLCTLQLSLASSMPELAGPKGHGGARSASLSASSLDELGTDADRWWRTLEAADARLRPWIESSVDELSAEASVAGGAARGSAATTFKAVRQGPLIQCEHLLAQMPRGTEARDRACHQSSQRVLGTERQPGKVDGESEPVTGELYDDSLFYHSLLKELLDTGSARGVPGSAPKLKHTKRPTNNRQSKGRKLSYEPQPKLLNFMFPEIPERTIVLAELFASVFGQHVAPPSSSISSAEPAPPMAGAADGELDVSKLFSAIK
jgi:protein AATF/BFR2